MKKDHFKCDECNFKGNRESQIDNHNCQKHHFNKSDPEYKRKENLKCEFCNFCFLTETKLVEHKKKEHFKCSKCDYTGRYLAIHMQKQHPNPRKHKQKIGSSQQKSDETKGVLPFLSNLRGIRRNCNP